MNQVSDIRWKQRFENLQAAYKRLAHAASVYQQQPKDDLMQMALIKAFEFTFELCWKTLKDYLQYNGVDLKLPREIIKFAFANGMIQDGDLWIDMLDNRNLMAHIYDEARALEAAEHITARYMMGIQQLQAYLAEQKG